MPANKTSSVSPDECRSTSGYKKEEPEELLRHFIEARVQEKTRAWEENYKQLADTLKELVVAVQQSLTEIHKEIGEVKKIITDVTDNTKKKSSYVA
jgi:vacuolar-type H+-ATPase subunit H